MGIDIDIAVEAGAWPQEERLRALAKRAIGAAVMELRKNPFPQEGRESERAELSLVFTDDAGIRRLNRDFRGKDKPTNVLSFPQEPAGPFLAMSYSRRKLFTGKRLLREKSLEDHMAHLIIHGFLHLLAYDHEADADAETMEALERAALKRLGISDPYAAA